MRSLISDNTWACFWTGQPYNDSDHANGALLAHDVTSQDEYQDSDRNRGNRQCKFDVFCVHYNDDELDGEAEEKEEIEFEKGDVNLVDVNAVLEYLK